MSKVSHPSRRSLCLLAAATALPLLAGVSRGAVLFSDSFTSPDGTAVPGRAPDGVDTSAAVYVANGGSAFTNAVVGGRAQIAVDEADALPTGITTATVYTVSDLFNNGTIGGADQNDRGEGLGFFSSVAAGRSGFHGDANFTGVTVSPAGVLNLISVTPAQAITTYSTATVAGYNAAVDHALAYTVSTATGLISAVTLDGSAITLTAPAGLFTPADTADVGFTVSANALGESATYDNLTVSVPEPASVGLVAAAAVGLLGRRRRAM